MSQGRKIFNCSSKSFATLSSIFRNYYLEHTAHSKLQSHKTPN